MNDETKENLTATEMKRAVSDGDSVTRAEISSPEDEEIPAEEARENDESESLSPRRKFLIIGGIVAACLLLIFVYLYYERSKTTDVSATTDAAKTETVVSVKVATATKEPIAREFTAIGTVAPARSSTVSASLSAQIKQMRLLKNQYVQQGEVLAILASQDLQAQRNEANAALDEARLNEQTLQKVTIPQARAQTEKDLSDAQAVADNVRAIYERRKDLYAKGGLSLKELESSGLALKNAENALRLAQNSVRLNTSAVNPNAQAIAQTKIKQAQQRINTIDTQANLAQVRAPISGVVTDQFQFEGEYASAGAKLLTIAASGEVIVKANFADSVVANLQTGDSVTIYPPNAPDERMGGKVTLISRSADALNRTVEIWASFANGRGLLRTGDAVQFVVSSNLTNDAVVVPAAAVTLDASNADEGTVMTVDKEMVAHETKVKVGIKTGDKIQITEGLTGGETVVIEGNYALPDGTKVEIAKDAPQEAN
ncbi:MAG: efflux RND transporter periplasmic adaptor subunit [Pyrinomonadaceae bacterium]|nr:efflux RND transporter periplasmic adaptor subunit [Pyrinomonadaceae bacterium]